MKIIDKRTKEEKEIYHVLITATDKFLSGWGGAEGGLSKVAWACKPEDSEKVFEWVKNRSDMKNVNIHIHNDWRPRNAVHVQIYIVKEGHPALLM